ncbi:MAG TPA: hypothetical protein VHX14_00080, partial [Thermoanaerobaculia bacterium]|nr:hypothetical protein [Thermoanaerobaculia bacterium]
MALLLLLASNIALGQIRSDQALAPVVFGAARARQEFARVASDGTNFFAVWRITTASNRVIGGGRISPAGELLDRPSILIASGSATTLGDADVVFVGGNFLVVYQSGTSVLTRRFSREGYWVDAQPFIINNSSLFGGLATNGKTVLLPTAPNRIQMLAADGTTLGPELVIPNEGFGSLSVASNGDRYLIAVPSDYVNPHGALVLLTGMGNLLAAKPIPVADPLFVWQVTVASNGSSFLVGMITDGPVACMHVGADGNTGALNRLDGPAGSRGKVVATWSGGEYTVVWSRTLSTLSTPVGIVGARVDAGGQPMDTTPVTVASYTAYSAVYASAWNGRDTIIITEENYTLTPAAIFTSLPQIDAEPAARRRVAIASSAAEQAGGSIASNGTLSLVTWRESSGLDHTIVRTAFIAADGQLGSPIELGDANSGTTTATTSNGRDFFVAYYDTHYHLVGRRVTLEGLLDSTPIVITPYSTPGDSLAAGWSGQAYVVVTAGAPYVTVSGVTPDGIVAVSRQVVTSAPADAAAVSCAANACSVTWHLASGPCYFEGCPVIENDVFARTSGNGNLVLQTSLTDSLPVTPALLLPATDGRSMFVYSNGKTMYAGRITAGGIVLDAPA